MVFWINLTTSFSWICCCGSPVLLDAPSSFFESLLKFFWGAGFDVRDVISCLLVRIRLLVERSCFKSSISFFREVISFLKVSFSICFCCLSRYLRWPVSTCSLIVTGVQYCLFNVVVIVISKVFFAKCLSKICVAFLF